MLAVIVGGTGFIGRSVVRLLQERSCRAVVVSRSSGLSRIDPASFDGAETPVLHWSVTTPEEPFIELLQAADAVIHLAGHSIAQGLWTAKQKQRILQSRVQTTARLVGLLDRAHSRACLVCASAVGFYGCAGNTLLDEQSPPGHGFLAGVCSQWERVAHLAAHRRVVILRLGVVLGRSGGLYPRLSRIGPLCGGVLGSGEQWMPWIHLADAAAMFVDAALDPGLEGVFNAVAPEQVTQRPFVKLMALHLDKPQLPPVPAWALRLVLGSEMADELLLCSQRVCPRRYQDAGRTWTFPTLDDALRDLAQGLS